jgi:hypothetical protein
MSFELIDALQFFAQATKGTVQTRLGSAQWDAECGRHVGQLEILTETERQQRSIVGVEMAHRPTDLVAIRQTGGTVGRWWRPWKPSGTIRSAFLRRAVSSAALTVIRRNHACHCSTSRNPGS